MKLRPDQPCPPVTWRAVDQSLVAIPDPDGKVVHLQFSRWAGCPICNMHLASFRRRADDLERADVREVIVFHSPEADILDLRGDLPFRLVADPTKAYYRAFGVGTSPFFLFHPKAFRAFRSEARQGRTAERIHGGVFGLPADFVVDRSGRLLAAHYGRHTDDCLPVDAVIELASRS